MVKVEWNRYSKSYLTFQFILYDLTLDNMGKSTQSHCIFSWPHLIEQA